MIWLILTTHDIFARLRVPRIFGNIDYIAEKQFYILLFKGHVGFTGNITNNLLLNYSDTVCNNPCFNARFQSFSH